MRTTMLAMAAVAAVITAAPALIVYEWALKGMGKLGWIAAFVAGSFLRK